MHALTSRPKSFVRDTLGPKYGGWGDAPAMGKFLVSPALLDLHTQPLDLLVQRRQRNFEVLRRLGLVPVASLQPVRDNAPLDLLHQVEETRIRAMIEQARRVGVSRERRR